LRDLFKTKAQDNYEHQFLFSEPGVEATFKAVDALFSTIENEIQKNNAESGISLFQARRAPTSEWLMSVYGPQSLRGLVTIQEVYRNSVTNARLIIGFDFIDDFADRQRHVGKTLYRPRCRENERIVWQQEDQKEYLTTEDLASKFFKELASIVEENEE
jgi:hypothetical protein